MNDKRIITFMLIAIIVVVLAATGYLLFSSPSSTSTAPPFQPVPTAVFLIKGRMVCLPGKQLGASDKWPCELGLLTDAGKYYEFQNTESVPGGIGSFAPTQRVSVTGEITSQKKYDTDGTIILGTISPEPYDEAKDGSGVVEQLIIEPTR